MVFIPTILVALISCNNQQIQLDLNWDKTVSVVIKDSQGVYLVNEVAKGSYDKDSFDFKSKHSKGEVDLKKKKADVKFEANGMTVEANGLECH